MSYLYIAEKPSTMMAVKKAYESSSRPLGNIDFVALAGHVCGLLEPKDYEQWQKKWKDIQLPMIPSEFKVKPIKNDIVKKIKDMVHNGNYEAIIVGTDSDVEGNGIYALLEKYLHLEGYKTLRFFEKDLTNKGIMESFASLTDFHKNERDVGMTNAYWIRAQFDWLIGFNLSVAYTVKTNMLMKVGRVKAPTLKLVYDNCKEIDNFVKKSSYLPSITTADPILNASLVDEEGKDITYEKQIEADRFLKVLGNTAVVKSMEKKETRKAPPQLYKLSDIQVEAGQKYGYSPEKTLSLIQSLYETHKIVSYPRTDGRYVSSEKSKEFQHLLDAVAAMPGMSDIVAKIDRSAIVAAAHNKRYVNDEEVKKSSHDALIPTGKKPNFSELNKDEQNICTMIYKRFLSIFLPDLIEEKRKYYLDVDGNTFICKGSTIIDPGFTDILDTNIKENELPKVTEEQKLKISKKYNHEVVSKPPVRFTQALLLKAMENIQKYMPESELKTVMKEVKGIGQPSSRGAIISELIRTGYISEKGKGLYMTDMGLAYIKYLDGQSVTDPALSAEWELHMQHIREGSEDYHAVKNQVYSYVRVVVQEVTNMEYQQYENKADIKCPLCGKAMRKLKFGYGCSGYPDCNFVIGEIAHKKLSENEIRELCHRKRTGTISGFTSKSGKKFDAKLILDDTGKISFEFDQNEEKSDLMCPSCGSNLIKYSWGYSCSEHNNGCSFAIGKICGKMLTESQIRTLLSRGEIGPLTGFTKKDGTKFEATLVLESKEIDGKAQCKIGFKKFASKENVSSDLYARCPKCGGKVIKSRYGWICEKGCKPSVPYELCKRTIEPEMAEALFTSGQTPILDGFISKKNKQFSAGLRFDDDKLVFYFPEKC